MKYTKESGVFHYFIFEKIKERNENPFSNIIKRVQVKEILYNYHIPIKLHQRFLREMERFGFMKLKDKKNIRLLK